jgi:HAD superfamily hydrolase (TIGR01484 family)
MDGVRLVASDLDGTLLLPDETVSERTRAALVAARSAGITVVLVSGRPPRSLGPIAERIGVGGVAICANGAIVWDLDTGTMLDSTPLAAELATREAGWSEGLAPAPADVLEADALELITGPVTKLLVRHPAMAFAEVAERARRVVGDDAVVTWAGLRLVEISAAGVTKAFALERLCRRLGVDAAEVVAVGDMPNDLPMLDWAGVGVAVANADQAVLAAADEVTASNLDDGVARLLERIIAARNGGTAPGR